MRKAVMSTTFLCRPDGRCDHDPQCPEIPNFWTPRHGIFIDCPWCHGEQMIQAAVDDYVVKCGTEDLVAWMFFCNYYSGGLYECRKPIVCSFGSYHVTTLDLFLQRNPGTELYLKARRDKEKKYKLCTIPAS